MNGHKDADGKFHPHNDTSNKLSSHQVESSKHGSVNQSDANKLKNKKSNEHYFNMHNWGLEIENGKVTEIRLGNWSDAGWNWDLSGKDANEALNTYLVRMSTSGVKDEFLEMMNKENVDFDIFRKQILENYSKPLADDEVSDDGLYSLTGDASNWKFGQDDTGDAVGDSYFDEVIDEEDREKISEESWRHHIPVGYQDWLKEHGESVRKEVIGFLKTSNSFEEYFDMLTDERFTYSILEDRITFAEQAQWESLSVASEILAKKGELKKETIEALNLG